MSASLLSKDTVRMCVCGWKKEKILALNPGKTAVSALPLLLLDQYWEREKKNNPLDPLLLQLSDEGLGFLQTLWRHRLSKGLGKLCDSRGMEGKPLPLPFSLPSIGGSSTGVPEMKRFSVCSASTASSPLLAPAQILRRFGTALPGGGAAPLRTCQLRMQPAGLPLGSLLFGQRGASRWSVHPLARILQLQGWADGGRGEGLLCFPGTES